MQNGTQYLFQKTNILNLLRSITLCFVFVISVQAKEGATKTHQEELVTALGIDYSKYGKMAENFSAGEKEYLESIESEKGEDRQDSIELWELSLDDMYDMGNQDSLPGDLVNFFQEMTPNMVDTWVGLEKGYELVYITHKQEQNIAKQEQDIAKLKIINEQMDSILSKLAGKKDNNSQAKKDQSSEKKQ